MDQWLRQRPFTPSERTPDITLLIEKRIYPRRPETPEKRPGLDLVFNVTVSNQTDDAYSELVLNYSHFKEFHSRLATWEEGESGELPCDLGPRERKVVQVPGAIAKQRGQYDSGIHRIVVRATLDGRVLASASDSPRLLASLLEPNAAETA